MRQHLLQILKVKRLDNGLPCTIRNADRITVIINGGVVECASAELILSCSLALPDRFSLWWLFPPPQRKTEKAVWQRDTI